LPQTSGAGQIESEEQWHQEEDLPRELQAVCTTEPDAGEFKISDLSTHAVPL